MQNIEHTPWWPQLVLTWKLAYKYLSLENNTFDRTTSLFQQLCQPTTVAYFVWHHCWRKRGYSVFSNRCTHKNTVLCFLSSFFFFFFPLLWILEKLVSNKWKDFASCLLITVSMSKCSWEICHIYFTVMAILWPPKECCCKA